MRGITDMMGKCLVTITRERPFVAKLVVKLRGQSDKWGLRR